MTLEPVEEPIAVSMREAIRLTSLSRPTLNRMVARGEIRKLKCGSKALFLFSELRRLIHELPAA